METTGVYVHVPFCERVCPYCDFAVVAARTLDPAVERRYVDALVRELGLRAGEWPRTLASVYFGGGTPSLLRPESVARVLDRVRECFDGGSASLEVTLEVNPSTVERERLPGFWAVGVNRISLGVQSFDDTVLRRLGRAHKADEGRESFAAARAAGFDNVSLDLIFAAPGQGRATLEADLNEVERLAPEHLSAYELTVEDGTPFALARERGQLALPGEDEAVDMIERVAARLESLGLARYELSSYGRPGRESRHNARYWRREPVLGVGLGAWSSKRRSSRAPHGAREANHRALGAYLSAIESGCDAIATSEVPDARTARGEVMFLALRTRRGLAAAEFEQEFGRPPRGFQGEEIEALVAGGLLDESSRGDLCLTRRGRLVADSVFAELV